MNNPPTDVRKGNMALAMSAIGVGAAGYFLYRYTSKPTVTPANAKADAGRVSANYQTHIADAGHIKNPSAHTQFVDKEIGLQDRAHAAVNKPKDFRAVQEKQFRQGGEAATEDPLLRRQSARAATA